MNHFEWQSLSKLEKARVAATIGLAVALLSLATRLSLGVFQPQTIPTWTFLIGALAWMAIAGKPGSFVDRRLFLVGLTVSTALLLHMMNVIWTHPGQTAYLLITVIVMCGLAAVGTNRLWLLSILCSWTIGLLLTGLLVADNGLWSGNYLMFICPVAIVTLVLGSVLHKARYQLEQQQLWLEKARSVSKMAGWEFDVKSGKFTWSPMASDLLNITDIQTHGPWRFVTQDDWDKLREGALQCLVEDKDFEMVVQGKDGDEQSRWFFVKAGRLGEPEAQRVGGVFQDITETMAKERELTRAKETAESAVVARTRFLANMSHEIRTPMNGVIGMASLLLEGELGSKERSYAEIIRNSGESLLTIINQILDFSKYEAGNVTLEEGEFRLEQLVTEALDIVDHPAERKGLKLHLDMPIASSVNYQGDSSRLRQVLVNLLSNAVKFTDTGSVTLNVSFEDIGHQQHKIVFEVIDTGIGITPAALPNLFDPFVQGDATTTRKFGGTGLGLAISREIVLAMNGEIDVYSHPKTGSTFRFYVPLRKLADEPVPHLDGAIADQFQLVTRDADLAELLSRRYTDIGGSLTCHETTAALNQPVTHVMLDVSYVSAADVTDLCANPDVSAVLIGPLGQRSAYRHLQDNWLRVPVLPSRLLVALDLKNAAEEREDTTGELEQFNHLRVLLAEDNAVNQKVAQQMLKKLGCVPDVAQNGRETLHMMSEKEYDLVFMDVQMPEVDGLEATRLIRINDDISQPYIVAMTANVMQEDREVCRNAGMDDFVAKPVRLDEVSKALRRASNQISTG